MSPAAESLPSAASVHAHPSDSGAVPEDERAPENPEVAALREEVARLASALADQQGASVAARSALPPREDALDTRKFPRGTLVTEVHEAERFEAERVLLREGLERAPEPLPEGSVTVDPAHYDGRSV